MLKEFLVASPWRANNFRFFMSPKIEKLPPVQIGRRHSPFLVIFESEGIIKICP